MRGKSAQQEMVGFILIVILVIVALMVFLVISMSKPLVSVESKLATNLLSSVMSYTTDCIVSEPYRENVMELIIECHEGSKCGNLDKMACDYLNETLVKVMSSLTESENSILSYQFTAYWEKEDEEKSTTFYSLSTGNCVGGTGARLRGENTPLNKDLRVSLELCTESNI